MVLCASDDSHGSVDGEELSSGTTVVGHKEDGLVTVYTLRKNDVLFGRGSGPNGFAGNVRYRNLIRSILIKACHINDDASRDSDIDFYLPDSNDQDVSSSRRNRILATQVVKAIKSRKGRFLQRVPSSGASNGKCSTSVSNHIERIMYKEVEESIAIEKTKQNFRDQLRRLQMEQRGGGKKIITAPAGTRLLSHEEDCWTLRSMNPIAPCSKADGKRKRANDDFSVSGAESLNVSNNKVISRFSPGTETSSQDVRREIQIDDVLAIGTCLPLPRTLANSFNDLLATRSLPSDSFLHPDDMMMDRELSSPHAVPLSQIVDRRNQRLSYRHLSTTSISPPFLPEGVRPIAYSDSRPQLLQDHLLSMKSSMILHPQEAFVAEKGLRPYTNGIPTLGGQIRDREDTLSHHGLVALSPSIKNRPLPSSMRVPGAGGASTGTTERVEAMIASHQTRRDRFWLGWATTSK